MGLDQYVMQLAVELKGVDLIVQSFSVQEELASPFLVSLVVHSKDGNKTIDLEKIVGRPASFALRSGLANAQSPNRLWTGVCNHAELLLAESTGYSSYFISLVPEMWLLTQRRDHRIFQRKNVVDIVNDVFDDWKLDKPNWQIKKEYEKLDYVVQYGETDFAFVSRLLERFGITYRFGFKEDKQKTELVMDDQPQQGTVRASTYHEWTPNHRDMAIPFQDVPNESGEREFVTNLRHSREVVPGKVTVREWDWRRKPDYAFLKSSLPPEDSPELFYEHYYYRPIESMRTDADSADGNTPEADRKGVVRHLPDRTEKFATIAVDGLRQTYQRITFKTNCVDLAPGTVFAIQDHPRKDLDPKNKWLVSRFTLEGVRDQEFTYRAEALTAKNAFRPRMRTPVPTIQGLQSAIVVGTPGAEVHTDEFGRVRVRFHWDRHSKFDDGASCWVRVSQTWAGAGFGSVILPRVGQEVLVAFVEGDPDHPLIVGRVFNNDNRTPYALPDHRTRSTWRSNSTVKGDGGFNEITFEDEPKKELVYIQAQLDMQKLVKRAETERTGNNRTRIVGENRSAIVKTVDATLVGDTWTTEMIAPPSKSDLKILEQQEPSVTAKDTHLEMKDKRVVFTTGKASVVFDDDKIVFDASGDIKVKADSGDVIIEGKKTYLNSMMGLSAAKPAALVDVKPTTFVPSTTDKKEFLYNEVKDESFRSRMDGGLVPKAENREKEKIEVIPCKLVNEEVTCQHGRRPNTDRTKGDLYVLEVVSESATGGDTISAKSKLVGGCGKHTEWKVGGFWTSTKQGTDITFAARGWLQGAPGIGWLGYVLPHLYTVYGYACSGGTQTYKIKCYPNDLLVFTWTPYQWPFIDKVNKAMTGFVQKLSPHLTLELAKGAGVAVKAQWKEWTDWRAFYRYEVDIQLSPLIRLQFKVPLGPHTPGFLKKYVEAGFYFRAFGEVSVQARWRRTSPETHHVFGDVVGYAGIAVGGEIVIMEGKVLKIVAEGEGKLEAVLSPDHKNIEEPKYDFKLNFMGLRAVFTFAAWSGKVQYQKAVNLIGPQSIYSANARSVIER